MRNSTNMHIISKYVCGDTSSWSGVCTVANEDRKILSISAFNTALSLKITVAESLENRKNAARQRINTRFKKAWDELAEL